MPDAQLLRTSLPQSVGLLCSNFAFIILTQGVARWPEPLRMLFYVIQTVYTRLQFNDCRGARLIQKV